MSFRTPFSKTREKVKHGLSKIGEKLKREGASAGGEGLDRPALSSQSITVEGKVRGEDNLVVGRGHDLGESSQSNPPLESGFGREGRDQTGAPRSDVGNRTPTPSISLRDGESEGMWIMPF